MVKTRFSKYSPNWKGCWECSAGSSPGPTPTLSSQASLQAPDRVADHGFTRLISRGHLTLGIILLSLLVAAFWGAVHALTPGHGKALVAGYLVGTRGRPRDAVLLGATVTITHTAGVFALGLVTLLLSQFVVPDRLYPWLTLASGLLVVCVGFSVFLQRLRSGGWHRHTHGHNHGHDHDPLGLLPVPAVVSREEVDRSHGY